MAVIGQDCHITLTHPNVNAGQPYGFLVDEESKIRPGGVEITHEINTDGTSRIYVLFDVLMADRAINPNGSAHTVTRMDDYEMLLQFIAQLSNIDLGTPVGTFLNLFAVGFTADERHLPESSLVKCQLNNAGIFWPPVPAGALADAIWDGAAIWLNSFWR